MVTKSHTYSAELTWIGNTGKGTLDYRSYKRDHDVSGQGKPTIPGSSDPAFRGVAERWNPEELLVVSLSQCHMLWYLDLASRAGIVVLEYTDTPSGKMVEEVGGAGQFSEVVLRPRVVVSEPSMVEQAEALHDKTHALCFIARSVNFDVSHLPTTVVANADPLGTPARESSARPPRF